MIVDILAIVYSHWGLASFQSSETANPCLVNRGNFCINAPSILMEFCSFQNSWGRKGQLGSRYPLTEVDEELET